MVTRRQFLAAGVVVVGGGVGSWNDGRMGEQGMYGLIGRIQAVPGQRDALANILLEGVSGMPGCLSYVVARDPGEADSIWVTEVWESQAAHEASLSLPSVQQAIAAGRPLIAGFFDRTETEPIGGHGLA